MKVSSFRSVLPAVLVLLCLVVGCLVNLPLSTWLWWAAPPVELYYIDAYFSSTMARGNPSATTRVQWLYKSGPGQADQLVEEPDVVADSPSNQSDFRVPMHLSSAARSAGWSYLIQGPRVTVKAAELEPFLRTEFYDGRRFWRLFVQPALYGMLVLILTLPARDWFVGRAHKERARRSLMLSELQAGSLLIRRAERPELRWFIVPGDRIVSWSKILLSKANDLAIAVVRESGGNRIPSADEDASATQTLAAPRTAPIQPQDVNVQAEPTVRLSHSVSSPDASNEVELRSPPSRPHKKPAKRRLIFPGAAGVKGADEGPRTWNESEWID